MSWVSILKKPYSIGGTETPVLYQGSQSEKDTGYWTPTTGSSKILITLQRSGTKLYIREDGKQAIEKTTPTTDFTFNQFGKRGNITTDSFNGSLYHFSAYNSYLQTNLEELEQSIIAKASLSKEISSYDIPE
jgi:hypothetical protein